MSSHKGSVVAQGNGAPSSKRETDTVELAELGPLLEEKGKRATTTSPAKAEEEQTCPVPQEEEEEVRILTLPLQAHHAMEKMEEFVYKVWEGRWRVIPYDVLPDWLKDNDYLLHGHRPPMPSFQACFKSIFRIHTETGNIWTHLLGFVLFLFLGILTMLRPNMYFMAPLQEKVVFGMFFLGAVLCLSFSWLFHTVYCHSESLSDFLQTGLFRDCSTDYGELCPLALLLLLLLPTAAAHLPLHRLCPGHFCHHCGTVGSVCHSQAPADKSSSSLIRFSMSWWLQQLSSTSMGFPTFRNSVMA